MDVSWPPFRMMSRLEKIRFSTFAVGVRNRFSLDEFVIVVMWDTCFHSPHVVGTLVADDGRVDATHECRHCGGVDMFSRSVVLCGPLTFSVHCT